MVWRDSDAAKRFEEFLGATGKEGPQIVARRGVEVAVFVSAQEWKDLIAKTQKSTVASVSQEKH